MRVRVENPLAGPVLLRIAVAGAELCGELRSARDPGWRVEVYEVDHRLERAGGAWWRENRIRRRFLRVDGSLLCDQEIAHNRARLFYEPTLLLPAARGEPACCAL